MRSPVFRRLIPSVLAAGVAATAFVPAEATAQSEPFRLSEVSGLPTWLLLSSTQQSRYERLTDQFRVSAPGDDDGVSLRTTFAAAGQWGAFRAGAEIADVRFYGADDNQPVGTSLVNAMEVLQVHVGANGGLRNGTFDARLGRLAINAGSRRYAGRHSFRAGINTFDGFDVRWTGESGRMLRAWAAAPVHKRPTDRESLVGNDVARDLFNDDALFWGAIGRTAPFADGIRAEAFLLGFHERDGDEGQTRNRDLLTPGVRLLRGPAPGTIDFEVEATLQTGAARATASPDDMDDLDHEAFFVHLAAAYTFSTAWSPRLQFLYDHATGDADPDDDVQGGFDTLFGVHRPWYGPTGIWSAFARNNIRSPALRLMVQPSCRVDGMVAWRGVWLEEAADGWSRAGLRDPAGESGTFVGNHFDGRIRFHVLPGNFTLDGGFAFLRYGSFSTDAPNAVPGATNPVYLYLQALITL